MLKIHVYKYYPLNYIHLLQLGPLNFCSCHWWFDVTCCLIHFAWHTIYWVILIYLNFIISRWSSQFVHQTSQREMWKEAIYEYKRYIAFSMNKIEAWISHPNFNWARCLSMLAVTPSMVMYCNRICPVIVSANVHHATPSSSCQRHQKYCLQPH